MEPSLGSTSTNRSALRPAKASRKSVTRAVSIFSPMLAGSIQPVGSLISLNDPGPSAVSTEIMLALATSSGSHSTRLRYSVRNFVDRAMSSSTTVSLFSSLA